VTVGAHGGLRDVRLDPRVSRRPDGAALAAGVVRTAGEAVARAEAEAGDLVRPLTGRRRGEPVDIMFDPALSEIDRLLTRPPAPPRLDGRPVPAEPDLPALRCDLLRSQARLREVRETATSPDGLVTATVGGRGELLELRLDERVFRRSDSRWLAGAIVTTAHRAVGQAAGKVAG
jgi:DNA-binding protein YbaB